MAKLIFTEEPFAGREFEFTHERTTVGREPGRDLVIHHDSVSHKHCEIIVNGPEVIVRDLGSKNGTFVDGIRLKDSQSQLKHGKVIRFGSVKARLELSREDSEDTATSLTVAGLFTKYDPEKHPKPKGKTDPDAPELELGSAEDDTDQTVMMAKPKGSPAPLDSMLPESEPSDIPGQRHGKKIIVAVVIAVIVLTLLLILFR